MQFVFGCYLARCRYFGFTRSTLTLHRLCVVHQLLCVLYKVVYMMSTNQNDYIDLLKEVSREEFKSLIIKRQ